MLKAPSEFVVVFLITSVLLILTLVIFISIIIYRSQQNQRKHIREFSNLRTQHENELLKSKLEIQEQTFRFLSNEIHDNIGQKLTLAKLHLNTVNLNNLDSTAQKINDSVELIGEAITDFSDISRSLSSEIVSNNGLPKALEFEIKQIQKLGLYEISLDISGDIVFLNTETELFLFRIVQEALTNIIKHAEANKIAIHVRYETDTVELSVTDNGKGFEQDQNCKKGNGISNMKKRANLIKGNCFIDSQMGIGTKINIKIPVYEQETVI